MNLGWVLNASLPDLRRQAESRMTTLCVINRGGAGTWNPETLQYEAESSAVYSGVCRVRAAVSQDRGSDAADQALIESQYILSAPVDGSEGVRAADVATITECPEDAALVGKKFTVIAMPAYSQGTARRIPVREVQ